MAGALESGKSLAEQILAKLPESMRGPVAAAFAAPEATDALILLGDAAMARPEFSRQMDALKKSTEELEATRAQVLADYNANKTWWETNAPKVTEYDRIKPEYDQLKTGVVKPEVKPTTSGLTKEEASELVANAMKDRDEGYARVLSWTTRMSVQHFNDFKEVLDTDALIEHAQKHRVSLLDAYKAVHGEKIAARDKAAEDARIDKLVQERFAERAKTQQHPFPVRGPEPSPLDALEQPDRTQRFTADSAAAMYESLVAGASR